MREERRDRDAWQPLWHALSAVFLADPFAFATRSALALLLRAGEIEVVYAGDRMWPALRHGQRIRCRPVGDGYPERGQVVLASPSGVPDLLRVVTSERDGVWLAGDADPAPPERVSRDAVAAVTMLGRRRPGRRARHRRRLWIDLREAVAHRSESPDDLAQTVKLKYETQARFYTTATIEGLAPQVREHFRRHVPRDGTVLVLGSGVGNECFALAEDGWHVKGVDFAPAMVEEAQRRARQRGIASEFLLRDLRSHDEPDQSISAVLFTWDVYSFLPSAPERRQLLHRMARWLRPGGSVYLSARVTTSPYEKLLLTAQRLGSPGGAWGASHTRWIDLEGRVRRSFVQLFTPRGLEREVDSCGFRLEQLDSGHVLLKPERTSRPVTP